MNHIERITRSVGFVNIIHKIKNTLGYDSVLLVQPKDTLSQYVYIFNEADFKILPNRSYWGGYTVDTGSNKEGAYLKIRISDHLGKSSRNQRIVIISNGNKASVFFDKRLIGGTNGY